MNEAEVFEFSQRAIWLLLKLSLPLMFVGLGVGLIVSLFQTLTSIQEATLTFVPKIIAILLALIFLMSFMFESMGTFMESIVDKIINIK